METTASMKELILDRHNKIRSGVATGTDTAADNKHFPTASNMMQLVRLFTFLVKSYNKGNLFQNF